MHSHVSHGKLQPYVLMRLCVRLSLLQVRGETRVPQHVKTPVPYAPDTVRHSFSQAEISAAWPTPTEGKKEDRPAGNALQPEESKAVEGKGGSEKTVEPESKTVDDKKV